MKNFIFALLLFAWSCAPNEPVEVLKWKQQAENITIIRDAYGVPHIYGKTDADAVFGLLYAQCEDDFNRVERNYTWAIGRLAEVEGEKALYSDLRARLFMTKEEAIANYENSPDWLKKLCNAFADGINYYLYTHPEVKPKLLTRFEPWMPMYFSEGSIGGDIERISTERIKAFYESRSSLALNAYDDGLIHRDPYLEPVGSNGFAISGARTASGNAMLLINPHTSFFFRGEVHVVSEEGLNAYGAVTWGQFFVYQGFNEKTGWMHTSTYTDVIDEFKEKVIEKDGQLKYQYGDEMRPVETDSVELSWAEDNQIKTKRFPVFRTHHGPVTHMIDDHWVATAMMWEPVKALSQSYIRTKLNNHGEFREMMNIRTNSSNNTVFADAEGNIAYYHGNFIPKRDEQFDYTKPIDGSNPQTDWNGLHEVDECIVVVNPSNGWIQNCNSTPFTCSGPESPKREDFPKYMSINKENFRGIQAVRLLTTKDDFTLDNLIETAYNPYLTAFEILIPSLVSAYDQRPNPEMRAAIDTLRNWNYRVSEGSIAMSLAHFYGTNFLKTGNFPEGSSHMEKIIHFSQNTSTEERLAVFRSTLDQLNTDFGTWSTPWGEINRYQRNDGNIVQNFDDNKPSTPIGMASARWGALASFGAYAYPGTKRIYGTHGNSFVAVVEFGPRLKAKSLLAGGQSGDPSSPHFDDQVENYRNAIFKDVLYYREDVENNAKRTYKPGG